MRKEMVVSGDAKKLMRLTKWMALYYLKNAFSLLRENYLVITRKLSRNYDKIMSLRVAFNLLFFLMQFMWPLNTDKMRFNA